MHGMTLQHALILGVILSGTAVVGTSLSHF
jgi:hypothetical protein